MLPSPFNYFEKIYCINLAHRQDRWSECVREFEKEKIVVERFDAFSGDNRPLAFNKSQYMCIKKAYEAGYNNVMIFEDDIQLMGTMHGHYFMNELPSDWSVVYMGGNLLGLDGLPFEPPVRHSAHAFRVFDMLTTVAVGYSRPMMKFILDNFDYKGFPIYDEWLRQNVLKTFKCFVIAPRIAMQRKSFSDIWNCDTDYTSLFERGNKILR